MLSQDSVGGPPHDFPVRRILDQPPGLLDKPFPVPHPDASPHFEKRVGYVGNLLRIRAEEYRFLVQNRFQRIVSTDRHERTPKEDDVRHRIDAGKLAYRIQKQDVDPFDARFPSPLCPSLGRDSLLFAYPFQFGTPLRVARRQEHLQMGHLLLQFCIDVEQYPFLPVVGASRHEDETILSKPHLLAKGLSLLFPVIRNRNVELHVPCQIHPPGIGSNPDDPVAIGPALHRKDVHAQEHFPQEEAKPTVAPAGSCGHAAVDDGRWNPLPSEHQEEIGPDLGFCVQEGPGLHVPEGQPDRNWIIKREAYDPFPVPELFLRRFTACGRDRRDDDRKPRAQLLQLANKGCRREDLAHGDCVDPEGPFLPGRLPTPEPHSLEEGRPTVLHADDLPQEPGKNQHRDEKDPHGVSPEHPTRRVFFPHICLHHVPLPAPCLIPSVRTGLDSFSSSIIHQAVSSRTTDTTLETRH